MNLRCLFLGHDWEPWREVGCRLETKCRRCPATRVRYPPPSTIFTKFLCDCLKTVLEYEIDKRKRREAPNRGRPVTG